MNIPSYSVNVGDVIAVREKSKSLEVITNSLLIQLKDVNMLSGIQI